MVFPPDSPIFFQDFSRIKIFRLKGKQKSTKTKVNATTISKSEKSNNTTSQVTNSRFGHTQMDTATDADLQLAKIRFRKLYKKAKDLGISDKDIQKISFMKKHKPKSFNIFTLCCKWFLFSLLIFCMTSFGIYGALYYGYVQRKTLAEASTLFTGIDLKIDNCVIPLSDLVLDFLRPPVTCDFCKGIKAFERVENLSHDDFVNKICIFW